MVFAKVELAVTELSTLADIVNLFHEMLLLRNPSLEDYNYQYRLTLLKETCSNLYQTKALTREQVKSLLDYAHRTIFKHLALFSVALYRKRKEVLKPLRVILPEPQFAPNLETDCREIIEPKNEEDDNLRTQADFY